MQVRLLEIFMCKCLYEHMLSILLSKLLGVPYFLDYKMHIPPQIWEGNGGASYSPNIAYLAHLGGGAGGEAGSQEAGAGSPLQEAGCGRSGVVLQALGWEEGVSRQCEARETGAESRLRHTILLGRRV